MASSFLSRWSKRKLEQDQGVDSTDKIDSIKSESALKETSGLEVSNSELTRSKSDAVTPDELDSSHQADTPQVEPKPVDSNQLEASTDDEELSVASLLATGAEKAVKKAALRKLFLSGEFSEVDALNDYDHDYSAVKS
ncbi:DUF3306 domain-containing protein, partial [Vibrio makurazakiensis]|uniref:DUF3306 domain-containing protein n=1 Tax=Vibrio makurazakiensis TaxID=2910250 RepID=UPI003D1201F0